jgi:hypothetical protein
MRLLVSHSLYVLAGTERLVTPKGRQKLFAMKFMRIKFFRSLGAPADDLHFVLISGSSEPPVAAA